MDSLAEIRFPFTFEIQPRGLFLTVWAETHKSPAGNQRATDYRSNNSASLEQLDLHPWSLAQCSVDWGKGGVGSCVECVP